MRQGELLALRWRDVDLDKAALQVVHSLQFSNGGKWTLSSPKTKQSRRQIVLAPMTVEALRGHRKRQLAERLALGSLWAEHELVFTQPGGEPLHREHVTQRQLKPLLKSAGLPCIRFHDLRHTAATLLLLQGVHPKVASEMLGHSNVGITLGLYSHVLPSMQEAAAAAMERVFSASASAS
jgi:integrase